MKATPLNLANNRPSVEWDEMGAHFTESIRHEYGTDPATRIYFTGGVIEGLGVDTVYFELTRGDIRTILLCMRPDEAAIMAWVLTGALYSHHMELIPSPEEPEKGEDS